MYTYAKAASYLGVVTLLVPLGSAVGQGDSTRRDLSLHGYVTQAAGVSRGGDVYGIPAAGTVDYRRIAVLGRASVTPSDRFVVQLANRRRGPSASNTDLRVDWAFYERTFGEGTRLRVGRSPTPSGIHNETRYVGHLLPFFQAPASVYREGEVTNEAIDGAVLIHEMFGTSSAPLEVVAYGGGVDRFGNGRGRDGGIEYAAGGHLWWSLPVNGLRVGTGAFRARLRPGPLPSFGGPPGGFASGAPTGVPTGAPTGAPTGMPTGVPNGAPAGAPAGAPTGVPAAGPPAGWPGSGAGSVPGAPSAAPAAMRGATRINVLTASVDGTFERFTTRAELTAVDVGEEAKVRAGYVQLGARVLGPLSAHAQLEGTRLVVDGVPTPPTFAPGQLRLTLGRDLGLGLTWELSDALHLKGEAHQFRGYDTDGSISVSGSPRDRRYFILGISAEF